MTRRREYTYSPRCVHEGCTERAYYVDTTIRDHDATVKSVAKRGGWRCVRHSQPNEVVTPENQWRATTLVACQEPYGLFWRREGEDKGGNGFAHGPGFKAFADDFPPGTRLVVMARAELPS